MSKTYRVGVVGFGMAGATVAHLLARAGHAVTLFERAPQVGPVGAGILLQPSGQIVLKKIGLLSKVASLGEPIDELHALTHRGHTLIRLSYAEIEPGCHAFGMHRGDLFEVLHEAVQAEGVTIRLAHEITGCRLEGTNVYACDTQECRHGPFDFLLATDGSRSRLRGDSNLKKVVHEYAYGALWAIGNSSAISRKLHQVTRGTRLLMGLLPMSQGRCSLFWSLGRHHYQRWLDDGVAAWKAEVLKLCPLAEELLAGITDCKQVAFTTYQHVWMPHWHDEHVLFMGDAAHAMSPHLGQGINLALVDACIFAECLERAADHREAFRNYTAQRRAHLRYYAWVTAFLTPFFQSGGLIKGWGRDLCLPLLPKIGPIRRRMLQTMSGLKPGFRGERLEV